MTTALHLATVQMSLEGGSHTYIHTQETAVQLYRPDGSVARALRPAADPDVRVKHPLQLLGAHSRETKDTRSLLHTAPAHLDASSRNPTRSVGRCRPVSVAQQNAAQAQARLSLSGSRTGRRVDAQGAADDAERPATRARVGTRKLHVEKMSILPREEGRKEGYETGFGHGRMIALANSRGRSSPDGVLSSWAIQTPGSSFAASSSRCRRIHVLSRRAHTAQGRRDPRSPWPHSPAQKRPPLSLLTVRGRWYRPKITPGLAEEPPGTWSHAPMARGPRRRFATDDRFTHPVYAAPRTPARCAVPNNPSELPSTLRWEPVASPSFSFAPSGYPVPQTDSSSTGASSRCRWKRERSGFSPRHDQPSSSLGPRSESRPRGLAAVGGGSCIGSDYLRTELVRSGRNGFGIGLFRVPWARPSPPSWNRRLPAHVLTPGFLGPPCRPRPHPRTPLSPPRNSTATSSRAPRHVKPAPALSPVGPSTYGIQSLLPVCFSWQRSTVEGSRSCLWRTGAAGSVAKDSGNSRGGGGAGLRLHPLRAPSAFRLYRYRSGIRSARPRRALAVASVAGGSMRRLFTGSVAATPLPHALPPPNVPPAAWDGLRLENEEGIVVVLRRAFLAGFRKGIWDAAPLAGAPCHGQWGLCTPQWIAISFRSAVCADREISSAKGRAQPCTPFPFTSPILPRTTARAPRPHPRSLVLFPAAARISRCARASVRDPEIARVCTGGSRKIACRAVALRSGMQAREASADVSFPATSTSSG
ncbi:hypothetical protein DFH07DRAFT_941034 [Mycena maculata]|uniref:Uncharacterized protein n=1 Tax=Mycena maculata TaxID=230809 RepID=A0AAD7NBX4_9AGAR|nr:hypothetical protein DFH07DRAFT_941034 [Mycena maculata]